MGAKCSVGENPGVTSPAPAAPRGADTLVAAFSEIARAASETLDVREIFEKVSTIVRPVLPHDRLALGLLSEDRTAVSLLAYTGERPPGMPATFHLSPGEVARRDWPFEIVSDITTELDPESERCRLMSAAGIRSFLRVPILFEGRWQSAGGLVFLSAAPGLYREEDVPAARFLADQIALLLAHQRLAEEERRLAAAREEADRLQARVERLTEELESRPGRGRIVAESAPLSPRACHRTGRPVCSCNRRARCPSSACSCRSTPTPATMESPIPTSDRLRGPVPNAPRRPRAGGRRGTVWRTQSPWARAIGRSRRVGMVSAGLPRDAVVLAVVARAAPHRAVGVIEQDGVDRSRGAGLELEPVTAQCELAAYPLWHRFVEHQPAGL